jgi:peptidoglycan/LPS O-acetylase OafA/YrhL
MKLKYIDSIRGVAILMVIFVHTSQPIKGLNSIIKGIADYGQMGVQLFFVASAYTLCLSASYRSKESHKIKKYLIRRFFRIAPLYYIGILVYFLISLVESIYRNGDIILHDRYTFQNLLSNLSFTHGFYGPANNNIVPGGWSIGTEMAFYLIFPSLYFISNKKIKSSKSVFLWILFGLFSSQIILFILMSNDINIENNNFIYYNLINQLPVFFIGIGYYFIIKHNSFNYNWMIDLAVFIFLTILSMYLWHIIKINYLFSVIPFISGLSFVFLIEVFRKIDFLNNKLLVRIGRVSFSMYIIHFIFAHHISGFILKVINPSNSLFLLFLFFITSVLGSFSLALLSQKYIEVPFIKLGKKIILNIRI